MTDDIDRLRLVRTEGVGPIAYRRLLQRYTTPEAALDALPRLAQAGGRSAPPVIPNRDSVVRELDSFAEMGAKMLFWGQKNYPPLLALLDDAPPALATLGSPTH